VFEAETEIEQRK